MFRTFVERKVRRQIVHRSLIISVLAFVAILALWYSESMALLVHPLRMFINNIHGGISAFAIQISGGSVQSFTLSPVGAYRIEFQGGSDALIFASGYLGSAMLGAVAFYLVNRAPHLLRGMAIVTGVFTIGFLLLFIRPDQAGGLISFVVCIGLGVLLIVLGWTGKGDINQLRSRKSVTQMVMNIVAVMTTLHIVLTIGFLLLFIRPDQAGGLISFVVCIGLGVMLIVLGWTGKGDINQLRSRKSVTQMVMNIVAVMTTLHIALDLAYVLKAPAISDGVITNTVAAFAESVLPASSVSVIAYAWAAIAIVLLGIAVNFSMLRPLKQIPKNDDIV